MQTLEAPETLEQQPATQMSAADKLRHMADWLDDHHYAEAELMLADVGRSNAPRLIFYKVSVLAAAFSGRECTKRLSGTSNVFSLSDDGIEFEAWQSHEPEPQTKSKVTL